MRLRNGESCDSRLADAAEVAPPGPLALFIEPLTLSIQLDVRKVRKMDEAPRRGANLSVPPPFPASVPKLCVFDGRSTLFSTRRLSPRVGRATCGQDAVRLQEIRRKMPGDGP